MEPLISDLAPIVLFVYNRPDHTRRTLESLFANPLARNSILYVFADGPKPGAGRAELKKVIAVRALLRKQSWAGELRVFESPDNRGLADSIVGGVQFVLSRHDRVIVLEDDLYLSPGFLSYMNDSLNLYAEDDRVMQVSGFTFPIQADSPETYFMDLTNCWGWATWRRAFSSFEPDARFLMRTIVDRGLEDSFTRGGVYPDFLRQLKANAEGRRKTWAIKWYAAVFIKEGLTLYPTTPLVRNIGLDGSGENCRGEESMIKGEVCDSIPVRRIPVKRHPLFSAQIQDHLSLLNVGLNHKRCSNARPRILGILFNVSPLLWLVRCFRSLYIWVAKRW